MTTQAGAAAPAPAVTAPVAAPAVVAAPLAVEAPKAPPVPAHPSHGEFKGGAAAYATPAIRRLAREFGVDLAKVKGTGRKGRIQKADVQADV